MTEPDSTNPTPDQGTTETGIPDTRVRDFLDALGQKTPTPGGGAAAGMTGAIAAALARMVVNYTVGKKKYAEHEAANTERLELLARGVEDMLGSCEADARAYAALNKLWSLDQNDPERVANWDSAVRGAIDAPRAVIDQCESLAQTLLACCSTTNRMLRSDLGVSAALTRASAQAAAWNVRINTPLLPDTDREEAETGTYACLMRIESLCAQVEERCA